METRKHWLLFLTGLFTDDKLWCALPRILAGVVMGGALIFFPAQPLRILEIFAWLLLPALFLPVRKLRSWQCYTAFGLALICAIVLWRKLWAAPGAGAAVWMIFSAVSAAIHGWRETKLGWKILEFGIAALECAIAAFFLWRSFCGDQPDLPLLFGFGILAAALFAAARFLRKF